MPIVYEVGGVRSASPSSRQVGCPTSLPTRSWSAHSTAQQPTTEPPRARRRASIASSANGSSPSASPALSMNARAALDGLAVAVVRARPRRDPRGRRAAISAHTTSSESVEPRAIVNVSSERERCGRHWRSPWRLTVDDRDGPPRQGSSTAPIDGGLAALAPVRSVAGAPLGGAVCEQRRRLRRQAARSRPGAA